MNKDVVGSLAWGVGIVVLALVASAARRHGHLDDESVTRWVVGATGLMVAWFGNRLPKAFLPSPWARQARRVAGWSLALSGLVHAALWAFAPLPVAVAGGSAAILAGIAVSLGTCHVLRTRDRHAGSGTP
jgi:hypothetical protein